MKDWAPIGWIAYISYGTTAFLIALGTAAKENLSLSDWFSPFFKIYVLGYGPAIFFMIATIFFIIQRIKSRNVTEVGDTTPGHRISVPVLPSTHSSVKPKKFYSDRNKSNLSDALTDLSETISKYSPNIMQKSQYVIEIWQLGSSRISSQDISNLIAELNEIGSLTNNLYQDLHSDK